MTTDIWEHRLEKVEKDTWRNPFARDRARIIHSAFFRRLQGKTQVLGLGESDFYRTRLTHSIEVAQIASGIVDFLQYKFPTAVPDEILPNSQLIEAISLAHDIGHPPFGHGGEVALNFVMRNYGGFEGNAQTLRIASKLGETSEKNGLNLTRRTLLGLIKYPAFHNSVVNKDRYMESKAPLRLGSYKPPKCIFDCDKEVFDFVCEPFNDKDRAEFTETAAKGPNEHLKPIHKSFDTSIMELADDIAYGVHDLEDAIALKLVTEKEWESAMETLADPAGEYPLRQRITGISEKLFSGNNKARKSAISELVGFFIENCYIHKSDLFSHALLDYNALMDDGASRVLDVFKGFVKINVVKTPEVQTLEYKGQQMIVRIFEALDANPEELLHRKYYKGYSESGKDRRYICDYLAGTTDDYATRLYHKIFSPSLGSIFDRL